MSEELAYGSIAGGCRSAIYKMTLNQLLFSNLVSFDEAVNSTSIDVLQLSNVIRSC